MRKRVIGYNGCMEFFLPDQEIKRLPPADTRLLNLRAEPYPDGKRLRVSLEITPFQKKPHIELALTDPVGEVAATTSIIEPVAWKLELNLHIRKSGLNITNGGTYKLLAILSFPELGEIDRRELIIKIPSTNG